MAARRPSTVRTSLASVVDADETAVLQQLLDASPTIPVALGSGWTVTNANDAFLELVGFVRRDLESGHAVRLDDIVLHWPSVRRTIEDRAECALSVHVRVPGPAQPVQLRWRWLDRDRERWAASFERRTSDEHGPQRIESRTDPLTGLPNRRQLLAVVERHLAIAPQRSFAVVFLDLDRFKLVNDTYGHRVGDQVLRTVGHRLQAFAAHMDTIARLGGDEFAACLANIECVDQVRALCAVLLDALAEPVQLPGRAFQLGASIGVALNEGRGLDAATLLGRADEAMYQAKTAGRNQVAVWKRTWTDTGSNVELSLRGLGAGTGIETLFQPIVGRAGEVVGYEALARWRQGSHLVGPDAFIPVAERTGAMHVVTARVLHQALTFASGLPEGVRVHVNVSQSEVTDSRLATLIARTAESVGVPPDRLCIEVTETMLALDLGLAARFLDDIRATGCTVAIDDFGVGYGPLTMAREVHVDCLKIDQSFVADLVEDEAARAVVGSIVALAHGLGATVVAEGVESAEVLEVLWSLDVDAVQGFEVGPPSVDGRADARHLRSGDASGHPG